jgi:sialic acid synthase SpsE
MSIGTEVPVADALPLSRGACRVVAEAGANHNNSIERAIEMSRLAAEAGAWAVKFQLYKAGRIASTKSPKYWTDKLGTSTQYEAFRKSDHVDYADYRHVADACREFGIVFFATPFDVDAVAALEKIGCPIHKIASGDITNKDLLLELGRTGKPVLLSTGASTPDEIDRAIEWLGSDPTRIVPLVCTLTYPTPDPDGHFARLEEFRRRFDPYLIGTSDHTLGVAGAWMTAALGGVCIEKHYTIDKSLGEVPDHAISVDPTELAEMVKACDRAAVLRGEAWIGIRDSERPARDHARRSLVAARDLSQGHIVQREDFLAKRPGTGMEPWRLDEILGRPLLKALEADDILDEDMIGT